MRKYGQYPSVTSVIAIHNSENNFLKLWSKNPENQLKLQESSSFGNTLHGYIEAYFHNSLIVEDNYDHEAYPVFTFFKKHFLPICRRFKNDMIFCEKKLTSDKFQIGGTLDLYLKTGTVIDFKTSSKEKPSMYLDGYKMQLAAYAALIKDNYPDYPINNGLLVIGVRNTDSIQLVSIDQDELLYYFNRFMFYRQEFYKKNNF